MQTSTSLQSHVPKKKTSLSDTLYWSSVGSCWIISTVAGESLAMGNSEVASAWHQNGMKSPETKTPQTGWRCAGPAIDRWSMTSHVKRYQCKWWWQCQSFNNSICDQLKAPTPAWCKWYLQKSPLFQHIIHCTSISHWSHRHLHGHMMSHGSLNLTWSKSLDQEDVDLESPEIANSHGFTSKTNPWRKGCVLNSGLNNGSISCWGWLLRSLRKHVVGLNGMYPVTVILCC